MVASKAATDNLGRLIVVQTTFETGIPIGTRFLMVGNTFEAGGVRIGWLGGRTGRLPFRPD